MIKDEEIRPERGRGMDMRIMFGYTKLDWVKKVLRHGG